MKIQSLTVLATALAALLGATTSFAQMGCTSWQKVGEEDVGIQLGKNQVHVTESGYAEGKTGTVQTENSNIIGFSLPDRDGFTQFEVEIDGSEMTIGNNDQEDSVINGTYIHSDTDCIVH